MLPFMNLMNLPSYQASAPTRRRKLRVGRTKGSAGAFGKIGDRRLWGRDTKAAEKARKGHADPRWNVVW